MSATSSIGQRMLLAIATVNQHAEHCFSENYKFGRRSGIDMDKFVACVNEQAGEELFVSAPAT